MLYRITFVVFHYRFQLHQLQVTSQEPVIYIISYIEMDNKSVWKHWDVKITYILFNPE